MLALGLSGCGILAGEPNSYPNLRDMPSLPEGVTPQAEREKIIKDLERENTEAPASPGRQPAVPPRATLLTSLSACLDDASAARIAQAVPPLRGTLHGDWQPTPPAGTGVTAAINATPGTVIVKFAPGAAALAEAEAARLRDAAARFIYQGGESVLIQARGRGTSSNEPGRPQPLAGLSLGLKRASAIADALISGGIAPNRIKIATAGEEDIPGVLDAKWGSAGPDGAIVVFEPTPAKP